MAKIITNISARYKYKVVYDQSRIAAIPGFPSCYKLSSFVKRAYNDDCEVGDTNIPTSPATNYIQFNPIIADRLILGGDICYDITGSDFEFFQPLLYIRNQIYTSVRAYTGESDIQIEYKYRDLATDGTPDSYEFSSTESIPDSTLPFERDRSAGIYMRFQSYSTYASCSPSGTISATNAWKVFTNRNVISSAIKNLGSGSRAYLSNNIHFATGAAYPGAYIMCSYVYKSTNGNYYQIPYTTGMFNIAYTLFPFIYNSHERDAAIYANSYWSASQREYFDDE